MPCSTLSTSCSSAAPLFPGSPPPSHSRVGSTSWGVAWPWPGFLLSAPQALDRRQITLTARALELLPRIFSFPSAKYQPTQSVPLVNTPNTWDDNQGAIYMLTDPKSAVESISELPRAPKAHRGSKWASPSNSLGGVSMRNSRVIVHLAVQSFYE